MWKNAFFGKARSPEGRELRESMRPFLKALGFLATTLFVGVMGFRIIEDYSLVDAVYMTVITMSTVGFGTIGELSSEGKLFSILLITVSAGSFVYAITTITTFVVEGEINHLFNRYKVNRKLGELKNHIIICGLGRNGREAAMELHRQKQPFVVIEADQHVIDDFLSTHDILVVQGDATLEEMLEKVNILTAKGLITALSTDAENVYITLTARGMNPRLEIVARVSHETSLTKLIRAGANHVIAPNLIGGRKMANLLTRPALIEFVELISGEGDPDFQLEDFPCMDHPQLLGKTLAELHIRSRAGVLVLGLKRGNDGHVELNPGPHAKLTGKDRIFVMGTVKQLAKFTEIYLS